MGEKEGRKGKRKKERMERKNERHDRWKERKKERLDGNKLRKKGCDTLISLIILNRGLKERKTEMIDEMNERK